MSPRNEISRQTSRKVQRPTSKSPPWRHHWPICLAAVGLAMVNLACAIFGPTTNDSVIRIQLPTLTRTPLPSLTPTPAAAQVVVAQPTAAANNAVLPSDTPTATPLPMPTPTDTYAAPPSAADNQNNSRPTLTSRVTLNVRSGPGPEHGVVGKLAVGQSTSITGQNPDGSWWQIEYPPGSGQQAWVSANPQYTTLSRTMPQAIAQALTPTGPPVAAAVTATSPLQTGSSLTPTPVPAASATAAEVPPTPSDTPTPAATPLPEGWVFTDLRLGPAPDGRDLLISGILINNTGTPQVLNTIDGLFYDSQGQSIDDTFYTLDYPINEVPQGGRIPFQIQLKNHPNAADVDLEVLAESGGDAPRQDFEFLEVNAVPQGDEYCVAGRVRNPGSKLGSYLLVAAVLYDGENKVINYYYDYFDDALPVLAGEQTQDGTVCVDPLQQEVARYELAAWGQ